MLRVLCGFSVGRQTARAAPASGRAGNRPMDGLSADAEGGDEVLMQLEPNAMEGIAVGGGKPGRVQGGILECVLEACRVTAEPGQHRGEAGLELLGCTTATRTKLGGFRAFHRPKLAVQIPKSPEAGFGALSRLPLFKSDVGPRTCQTAMRKRSGVSKTGPVAFPLVLLLCAAVPQMRRSFPELSSQNFWWSPARRMSPQVSLAAGP